MDWINFINYIFVDVYGCILSVAFGGNQKKSKSWKAIFALILVTLLLQAIIYGLFGLEAIRKCYPLVTHLPLLLTIWFIQKRFLCSITAVLTAYLCCQLRRWISLLLAFFLGGGESLLMIVQIFITAPLLWGLLRFAKSPMRQLNLRKNREILQFMMISLIYYIFDYVTTVYTDILYSGNQLVVEFMPFVCCIAYFVFIFYSSWKERELLVMEMERNQLNLQTKQALQELSVLRQSQEQAKVYRHDLRHHLQYLACCMENGELERGQEYIKNINEEIEAQKVINYCENETVNLILSAYVKRATKANVEMRVQVSLCEYPKVSASDLSILLSNALENALHECQVLRSSGINAQIIITGYEKNQRLILQIVNTCRKDLVLEDGVPVTNRPGHGIGVRSICTVVERYQGIYSFRVKDGMFYFRASI